MSNNDAINLVKNELGNTEEKSSPSKPINLRKYTIYGTFDSDICSRRCKKFNIINYYKNVFVNNLRN